MCRVDFVQATSCNLLSCTLAWDAADLSGNASLEAAAHQALAALASLRVPASPAAPALQVHICSTGIPCNG